MLETDADKLTLMSEEKKKMNSLPYNDLLLVMTDEWCEALMMTHKIIQIVSKNHSTTHMNQIQRNGRSQLDKIPGDGRLICSKWVFKKKKRNGVYRARFVGLGYSQVPGVDNSTIS